MTHTQIKDYLVNYAVDEMTRFFIEDYHVGIQEALDTIYNSDTYRKLTDEQTGLYIQSPAYVYELLNAEYRTGALNA